MIVNRTFNTLALQIELEHRFTAGYGKICLSMHYKGSLRPMHPLSGPICRTVSYRSATVGHFGCYRYSAPTEYSLLPITVVNTTHSCPTVSVHDKQACLNSIQQPL